ncbi:MAG: hypothetical protein BWK78_02095 [Thiotrichaceae bacterium IS1]|nr:MAG: hypothetical protein BWK78_02095 [Thiotrichaceae bacterium IS1]
MQQWFILGSFIVLVVVIWHHVWHRLVPHYKFLLDNPRGAKFISALLIGIIIHLVLELFHDAHWLTDMEDAGMDFAMQIQAKKGVVQSKEKMLSFVLLDIDNEIHQQILKEPLFTPRDYTRNLIKFATDNGAKVVVVDLDLSRPTLTKEQLEKLTKEQLEKVKVSEVLTREQLAKVSGVLTGDPRKLTLHPTLHPDDEELYKYLNEYKRETCQTPEGKEKKCPLIILARDFKPISDSFQSTKDAEKNKERIQEPRFGFLESAVKNSAPYVQWASPLFRRSSDGVLRRWGLWVPTCKGTQFDIIPSIQLLTVAFLCNKEDVKVVESKLKNLESKFFKDTQQRCEFNNFISPLVLDKDETDKNAKEEPFCNDDKNLRLTGESKGIYGRILYRMPWKFPDSTTYKDGIRYDEYSRNDEDNKEHLVLTVANSKANPSIIKLKDKIVVIGGSYQDGGDMHETPLNYRVDKEKPSEMPGGLVLINAINSLWEKGEINPISPWITWTITIGSILAVSSLLAVLKSFLWLLALLLTGFVIMVPFATTWLFDKGQWLSFSLPLFGVEVHYIIALYEAREGNANVFEDILLRLYRDHKL